MDGSNLQSLPTELWLVFQSLLAPLIGPLSEGLRELSQQRWSRGLLSKDPGRIMGRKGLSCSMTVS